MGLSLAGELAGLIAHDRAQDPSFANSKIFCCLGLTGLGRHAVLE